MIGVCLSFGLFLYLARQFYLDFYRYDKTALTLSVQLPALFYFAYFSLIVFFGPSEIKAILSDAGYRRNGLFSLFLPLAGLTLASFPYQVSEYTDSHLPIARAKLTFVFRYFGWLLVCISILRNAMMLYL